jgi:hypothetical protein
VALEAPTEAGLIVEGVVVVLDEDSVPPPPSESHDVVMAPASEPAQMTVTTSLPPIVEVSEPFLSMFKPATYQGEYPR